MSSAVLLFQVFSYYAGGVVGNIAAVWVGEERVALKSLISIFVFDSARYRALGITEMT